MKRRIAMAVVAVLLLAAAGVAVLAEGGLPTIDWWVSGGAGGTSSAGVVVVNDTLGQAVIGSSSAAGVSLNAGYWQEALPTATATATGTATASPTQTPTNTTTATPTEMATVTASATPTQTPAAAQTPRTPRPTNTPTSTRIPVPPDLCPGQAILRSDAGASAPYRDANHDTWLADQAYQPGITTWGYTMAPNTSTYLTTDTIRGTADQQLYQTERWWVGSGGYRVEAPNGYYRVLLKLAEIYPWAGRATRVFSVALEGYNLLSKVDVAATVGQYRAYDVSLDTYVGDGVLTLDLLAQVGSPAIKAVAVYPLSACAAPPEPTATTTATPGSGNVLYRVNAGGAAYVDGSGQLWAADQAYTPGGWGYTGGFVYSTTAGIGGTMDDPLFQTERWWSGTGVYQFTVPNGSYDVQLKFAEIYPTAYRGMRVFDISVEGVLARSGLDLASAVGLYNPMDVSVPDVVVTDGVLNITLVARSGSPKISAISIISH